MSLKSRTLPNHHFISSSHYLLLLVLLLLNSYLLESLLLPYPLMLDISILPLLSLQQKKYPSHLNILWLLFLEAYKELTLTKLKLLSGMTKEMRFHQQSLLIIMNQPTLSLQPNKIGPHTCIS